MLAKIQIQIQTSDSKVGVGKFLYVEFTKEISKTGSIICRYFLQDLSYRNRSEY